MTNAHIHTRSIFQHRTFYCCMRLMRSMRTGCTTKVKVKVKQPLSWLISALYLQMLKHAQRHLSPANQIHKYFKSSFHAIAPKTCTTASKLLTLCAHTASAFNSFLPPIQLQLALLRLIFPKTNELCSAGLPLHCTMH